jgi:ABC-2 type transport system permease protein
MSTATEELHVQTSEPPRLHVVARTRELTRARQILWNLVRKEVKVKYKSSVLGAAWAMLNPILYLAVFTLVFGVIIHQGVPDFPIYLLSGLLAWQTFSTAQSLAARSVVDNSNLVTKVYFPREILPLASMGAAMVDFFFQAIVLVVFMAAFQAFHFGTNLLLLPLAMVDLVVFTGVLALLVASLNVRYRDTQHLLNILLLLWFWGTPIVYKSYAVYSSGKTIFGISLWDVFLLNPMHDIVLGFQRALYAVVAPIGVKGVPVPVLPPVSVAWLAGLLTVVFVASTVLLWLAWRTFFRMSGDFAEEL